MSDMKGVTLYNEGWVADCDVCQAAIKYASTKRVLLVGLRDVRNRHLRNECPYRDERTESTT